MLCIHTLPLALINSWVELALLIFFLVFVAIVIWVIFTRPEKFREAAQIPLDDQTVITPRPNNSLTANEESS